MSDQMRLLTVDDEAHICELVRDVAEGLGFEVETTTNANEFGDGFLNFDPSVVTLDLQMPGTDGIELLRFLADERSNVQVVLVSGSDRKVLDTAKRIGESRGVNISAILQKPFSLDALEAVLTAAAKSESKVTTLELRRALKDRELRVHYQPKIDLAYDSPWHNVGVEALVRWQHPVRGLLWPGSFIPLAEETGMIYDLTDYVVDAVLTRLKLWHDGGVVQSAAVNLSTQFLDDLTLPDRLSELVREHKVEPEWLTLEITESSAMADTTRAMDVLTRLRLKGFTLAIDDFGTGYSSLSQLHHMPFNELKIDKEFVCDLTSNEDSRSIVRSLVNLGKDLGMKICAEGVEDADTLEIVRDYGCDLAQGYHFSKPLPSSELIELIQSWRRSDEGSKQ